MLRAMILHIFLWTSQSQSTPSMISHVAVDFSASSGLFARGRSAITKSFLGFAALIISNTCLVVSGRLEMMKMIDSIVRDPLLERDSRTPTELGFGEAPERKSDG
jgi:hypothetical protein